MKKAVIKKEKKVPFMETVNFLYLNLVFFAAMIGLVIYNCITHGVSWGSTYVSGW